MGKVVVRCAGCKNKVTAFEQADGTKKWGHAIDPKTMRPVAFGRPHEIVPYVDNY